jgi:hypothetical protein
VAGDTGTPFDQPVPDDGPSPEQFGVGPSSDRSRRPSGLRILAVGFAAVLAGVGLLITGDFVQHSVRTYNEVCADVPGCHPGTDLSGGMYGGGILLLGLGSLLVAIAFLRTFAGVPRD